MKRIFRNWVVRYCYLTFPLIAIALILGLQFMFNFIRFIKNDITQDIANGSYAILGFLITSISIFAAFNKNTTFMKLFVKYGHNIIFYKAVIICGVASIFNIILSFININNSFISLLLFVIIITEIIIIANSIIKTSIYSSSES